MLIIFKEIIAWQYIQSEWSFCEVNIAYNSVLFFYTGSFTGSVSDFVSFCFVAIFIGVN